MNLIFHIDVNSAFLSWTALKLLEEQPDSVDPADDSLHHRRRRQRPATESYWQSPFPPRSSAFTRRSRWPRALRKCPGLVVAPPDRKLYKEKSQALMALLRSYTPDLEQISIDECFLDYAPIRHLFPSPKEGGADHRGPDPGGAWLYRKHRNRPQ